jgi:flagellar hook-length control protein FliK
MQYVNLDLSSRGSSADAASLFVTSESVRPARSESFDKHLQRPEPKPVALPTERSARRDSPPPQTPAPNGQADSTPEKRIEPTSESPPAKDSSAPPVENNSTPQGAAPAEEGSAESAAPAKQPQAPQQVVAEKDGETAMETPAVDLTLTTVTLDPEVVPDGKSPADGKDPNSSPADKTRGNKKNSRGGTTPRQTGIEVKVSTAVNPDVPAQSIQEPELEAAAKRETALPAERPVKETRPVEVDVVPPSDVTPAIEVGESVPVAPVPAAVAAVVESSPTAVEKSNVRNRDDGTGESARQLPGVQDQWERTESESEPEPVPQSRALSRTNRPRPTSNSAAQPAPRVNGPVDHSAPPAASTTTEQLADAVDAALDLAPTSRVESANDAPPTPTSAAGAAPVAPSLRFAQHLAARPGERSAKISPLSDLERVRLVDRVARAFRAAEERGGTVTLRLHPPELGSIRVELSVTDGALSAKLEAETPAARTALLDNVQLLHDRLAEQGVRIERFDVDLLDHRSPGDAPAFAQNQRHEQEARRQPASPSGNDQLEQESDRPVPQPRGPGQLNVVV